jgi:hypothetical protein
MPAGHGVSAAIDDKRKRVARRMTRGRPELAATQQAGMSARPVRRSEGRIGPPLLQADQHEGLSKSLQTPT